LEVRQFWIAHAGLLVLFLGSCPDHDDGRRGEEEVRGTYLPVDNLVAWFDWCLYYLIVNRREVRSSGISEFLLKARLWYIPLLTFLKHTTKDV
jgi:hypothetical protein